MKTLFLAAGLAVAAAAPASAAEVVMRFAHQLPPAHHIAQLVESWAADIEKRSNNRIDVQVLGAAQAFQPNQYHPVVARGQIESAMVVNFQWGSLIPETNVTLIPYYFTDLEKIKKFPGSPVAALLEKKMLEKGVRNIAWFYTTRQSIFTSSNRPLIKPEDFKGTKIRGLNKLVDNSLLAVGAAPSALPGSEVYQGLQTKVIDAGLTDISAAYSRKYYEVQSFGTVTPFFTVYFHAFVNPAWYDKLPAELKKAIADASAKAEADAIALTEKTAADAVTQLRDKGMKLHIHTPAEIAALKAVMQKPVMDAFLAESKDGKEILDLLGKL